MPEHRHDKVEHFIIHLVAVLFLFSTISAAFLTYGVYQNESSETFYLPRTPVPVRASANNWVQNDWSGGTASSTSIAWGSTSWDKYSSATNVDIGSGYVIWNTWKGDPPGSLISSVLNLGNTRASLAYFSPSGASPGSPPKYYVRTASSESAINSASWALVDAQNGAYPGNNQYLQYKVEWDSSSSGCSFSGFTINQKILGIGGVVTDATNGSGVVGASVSLDTGQSTTTASGFSGLVPNQFVKPASAAGGPPDPGEFSFPSIGFDASKTSYTFTVTKTGYNTKSQSFNVPQEGSYPWLEANISLTPTSSSSNKSSSKTSTGTTASVPSVSLSEFQQIKLPAVFTAAGSTTTDLSKVTDNKKIENFTLDIPGKNKIIFKETLDLSAKSTADTLKELDKYVKIDGVGVIELDSKKLPALNKKASLTMSGLKYLGTPAVLVDGKAATQGLVNNIKYTNGTLTFDVSHFTKYEAAAKFDLLAPISTSVSSPNTIIKARISDPAAVVSGTFNDVTLAKITPNPKTGEFTIKKLVFKEGENTLKLSGQSKLGKVAPLNVTFFYGTAKTTAKTSPPELYKSLLIVLFVALAFAILLGYLIYRRKKLHFKGIFGGEKKEVQEQPESK